MVILVAQSNDLAAGGDCPYTGSLVVACCGKVSSVRAEGQDMYPLLVADIPIPGETNLPAIGHRP